MILRESGSDVQHFIPMPYVNLFHGASYSFLSIFWFWGNSSFLTSTFYEFRRTRFSSIIYTLLIWITSMKCSIHLQDFIKFGFL